MMDELAELEQETARTGALDPATGAGLREGFGLLFWVEKSVAELRQQARDHELAHRTALRSERQAAARGWIKVGAEALGLVAGAALLGFGLVHPPPDLIETFRLLR